MCTGTSMADSTCYGRGRLVVSNLRTHSATDSGGISSSCCKTWREVFIAKIQEQRNKTQMAMRGVPPMVRKTREPQTRCLVSEMRECSDKDRMENATDELRSGSKFHPHAIVTLKFASINFLASLTARSILSQGASKSHGPRLGMIQHGAFQKMETGVSLHLVYGK